MKDEENSASPIEGDDKNRASPIEGDDKKDSATEISIRPALNSASLQINLPVLKAAFKRAAIYSSTLTFIVGVLGTS